MDGVPRKHPSFGHWQHRPATPRPANPVWERRRVPGRSNSPVFFPWPPALWIRNGLLSVTDGPFAETKEQLGGFVLIEAKDLDDAIRVASKIPVIRLGCIELWPINELLRSGGRG